MKTRKELKLYERLPVSRTTATQRQATADQVQADAVQFWLNGLSVEQISAATGVSVRHVNRLLAPERKLMATGGYDTEMARKTADGVTNLPTLATGGKGKPGRPLKPLSPDEQAMREEHASKGTPIAELARKYKSYSSRVRYVLMKAPSVLK